MSRTNIVRNILLATYPFFFSTILNLLLHYLKQFLENESMIFFFFPWSTVYTVKNSTNVNYNVKETLPCFYIYLRISWKTDFRLSSIMAPHIFHVSKACVWRHVRTENSYKICLPTYCVKCPWFWFRPIFDPYTWRAVFLYHGWDFGYPVTTLVCH